MKRWLWVSALAMSLIAFSALAEDTGKMLAPNANLKADGMPDIAASLVDKVAPYTEFRGHGFVDWHPSEPVMLVRHREAGANTAQIYLLSAPAGKLEKLTDFPDPVSRASFNPVHGNYIVYARDSGGNEATQIFQMNLATRQSSLLSAPDQRSSASWTRHGGRLLISAVPLDKTALGGKRDKVVTTLSLIDPLKPNSARRLAELPGGGWGGYSFSHDDRRIAALQYRTPSDSDVYLIDARTGAHKKILPTKGAPAAGFGEVEWSRDNRRLFLTTNQGGEFFELAVYELATGKLKVLSHHIPWDIGSFTLSKDGKRLLAVVNNNGREELRLFDATTGKELPRPAIPTGSISGGSWHERYGGRFAFSLNSPQSPGDVYSYDVATGQTQRWTTAYAAPGIHPDTFVSPELVQIKSFDGLPISGWLYLPDAARFPGKRPVIVDFHGGPEGQSTVHFMGRWNYYLNEMGLAILLPNVRGSSGYGKSFMDLDNGFRRKDLSLIHI